MKTLKFVLVLTTAVLAVASQAQGFGMMMAPGGSPPKSMLLFRMSREGASIRADVSKELKLTDDQKSKLDKVQADQRQKMMDAFQGGFDPSDREKLSKMIGDMMKESDKAAMAVLNEEQAKRLNELWIQRSGNSAIANPEVQKELGLNETQIKKIKDLQDKQQQANQAMMQKIQNQEIDFQEMRDQSAKNQKILLEEFGKVLTTDQAAKLKKMGGAEFKFEDNA